MNRISVSQSRYLAQLVALAQQRPRVSVRMTALCQLLENYRLWDRWKQHRLCFLTHTEANLIELYLHHGKETPLVEVTSLTPPQINATLNRAIRKLKEGRQDYELVAASIETNQPLSDWDCTALILERPFVLFNFPTQVIHRLLRSGCRTFLEMEETHGISRYLDHGYGIGPTGLAAIRTCFERYDLHGLLQPAQVDATSELLALKDRSHRAQQMPLPSD